MTNLSAPSFAPIENAKLCVICEHDLPELARFIAGQLGAGLEEDIGSRLAWLLLENPARHAGAPLGLVLRSCAGQLVGCLLCLPQMFRFEQKTFLLIGSSCFYVDDGYRGCGGRIFLKYSQLGREWALFGNSANANAAQLWKARGASPVPHSDHELLGVINWGPMLEEIVTRKNGAGRLPRFIGRFVSCLPGSSYLGFRVNGSDAGELILLTSADQVMDLPVTKPSAALTAARDLPYIQWRYFSGRDPTVSVFAYCNPRLDTEVLVTVNQRTRGCRGQIRTLNVLDIYPEMPPESCLEIVKLLAMRYRQSTDAIVVRSQDPCRQSVFRRAGFLRRQFEVPNAWLLDRSGFLPTHTLHLVPADGDWIL